VKLYAQTSETRDAGPCSFRLNSYTACTRLPEHAYAEPYLCFVVDGGFREWSRGELTRYQAGTVHYHPAEDWQFVEIGMDGAICLSVSPRNVPPAGADVPLEALGALREELIASFFDPSAGGQSRLEAVSAKLASHVRGEVNLPPLWLQAAEIELRSSNSGTISAIAGEVGIHPIHLWRTFKAWYGMTPKEYARQAKVELVKSLLTTSSMSQREIAAEAGFSDESHMIRVFRARQGVTPAQYRQNALR
jgi:AraC family transcriptional regulator